MTRLCDVCGAEYAPKLSTSRYCSDRCRQRKRRGASVRAAVAQTAPERTSFVYETMLAELQRHGVDLTSYEAASALRLAELFDDPTNSPTDLVAYSRELRQKAQKLLRLQPEWLPRHRRAAVASPPDELARRRRDPDGAA